MSETGFLKLKKHDNVETNTEKFDIENYLNGNWDKIDKNVGEVNTDISNINSKNKEQDTNIEQLQENTETSSNKIAELEKELKEAQEDFYQNSIRGQASGEYIHVEDSSNCRAKIGIGGNSEQETRSGKNYLNTLAKYKAGDTVTIEGITYTFNDDGSITLNGTASATANSNLDFSVDAQKINGTNKKIVGLLTGSQVPSKMALTAYTSTWGANPTLTFSEVNKSLTINMQSNAEYTIFRISVYSGTTVNNQTVYYQILDASETDLTYEQYGASPSPDYISSIKAVGSNVNLFDKNKFNNFTKNLQYIELTLKPNTEYTMRSNITRDKDGCNLFAYKTGEAASSGSNFVVDGTDRIVTTGDDGIIIIAYRNYNASLSDDPKNDYKYKLVEGTEVGEYSSYGQGCVKVTKCNNNLFNKNDIVNKAYINSSGEIVSNDGQNYTNYISVVSNAMYTIHAENPLGAVTAICFYDTNKKFLSGSTYNNVKSMSFKTPSNCDFVRASVSNINLETLQIEEGPATTYEEHEEQSYIIPTQKEMLQGDYFDFDNKKEVHIWGKTVLTGDENWKLESTGRFGIIKSDLPEIPAATSNNNDYLGNMCNSYKESTPVLTWKKVQGFCVDMSSCLRIYDDKYSTNNDLEGFKAYLKSKYDAGTPVMIYYKLQTPTRLAFTDEQKAVAKELNNARTYKNVTNITTDSKAILSLDYVKDQETQNQKMQNEIDEIKQLLSTTQTSALLLDNMQTDIESEVK